jgi:hypothetical protein
MNANDDADPCDRAIDRLTPDARAALGRSLLRALGRRPPPEAHADDRLNTTIEVLAATATARELTAAVTRAASQQERSPLVRLGEEDGYVLLASPRHLWRLAERIDELELALAVLASAWVRGMAGTRAMEELLRKLALDGCGASP